MNVSRKVLQYTMIHTSFNSFFRHGSEDNLSSDLDDTQALRPLSELADDEHFSDDSLEGILPPPPPPINKRSSIAWEVPLDDEALLTPGNNNV